MGKSHFSGDLAAPVDAFPVLTVTTPGRACQGQKCVVVQSTGSGRPARRVAQGFLHGITRDTDPAVTEALRVRQWRLSHATTYDLARAQGANVTWIVSDSWWQETCRSGSRACPIPPWEDWARYEDFVRRLVRRSITSGRPVQYWDIVNEPGTPETGSGVVPLYLEQFRRAHDAIRSIDPQAKIVGPSLPAFADKPYALSDYRSGVSHLDLQTFLNYIDRTQLRFDALSWHEYSSDSREANPVNSPDDVVAHVQRARKLISDRPGVGRVEIHVNEYGVPESRRSPGWNAGWIGALESASVDAAMRTCWNENDAGHPPYSGCHAGALDGLLERDARTPRPVYWVHRAYADMTGTVVSAIAGRQLSSYATKDLNTRELRVLIGRHVRCAAGRTPDCSDSEPAAAIDLDVEIQFPYDPDDARVTIERIPNSRGALTRPQRVFAGSVELDGGWVTVRVPKVDDGDALAIVMAQR